MAIWAATQGSEEGFEAFDAWSQKWVKYDADGTRKAWEEITRSPPTEIDAGTLFYLANEADPERWRRYHPGDDGPVALGFTREGNFAFRDRVRNLIVVSSSGQLLAPQHLLGLMPSKFWMERFPSKTRTGSDWFNALAAGEALMAACRSAGPFNPLRIRGRGIWREGDNIIINLGGPIPATAKFHYVCFEPIPFDPIVHFDVPRLLKLFRLFPWRNPQDAMLLLGWAALAPICGVLDWRPHGFIWGGPQTGKTTIHTLLKYLLTPMVVSTEGGSTEAGIRQTLGPDSQPVIIDEFESDQHRDNIRRVLRLMRSASSADNPLLRGTPEGRALEFSLRTTFLVCAVNCTGLTPADQSRILLLELTKHNNDKETAQTIAAGERHFRDQGPHWCGYMVSLAKLMQPALRAFQSQMPIADRHHRQNFATILAAAFIALEGRTPTEDEVNQWIADYTPAMERHAEDSARDNSLECFDHLRDHIIERYTLSRWIATAMLDGGEYRTNDADRIIHAYGIAVKEIEGETFVCLRNGAPNINNIFTNTAWWGRGWQRALRALDGAVSPRDPVRFGGNDKSRAVGIPATYFAGDDPIESTGSTVDGPAF
jgi:hypothetical protein